MKTEIKPIAYNKVIMTETIRYYGINNQLTVATEEMAELTQVLSKVIRGSLIDREHLIEEYSDVLYMMEQLKYIFNIEDKEVSDMIWKKQNRQAKRMIDKDGVC